MGCTPSVQISPLLGEFCRGRRNRGDRSPPYSSNHLLLSGVETTRAQLTPLKLDRMKSGEDEVQIEEQRNVCVGPMRLIRGPTKVLLVFPKEEGVCCAWNVCCKKQGFEVVVKGNVDDAHKLHSELHFDLIVVDVRSSKFIRRPETLVESLKGSEDSPNCVLVALIKRSAAERNGADKIPAMLNSGFDRIVVECSSQTVVRNELLQIQKTELHFQEQRKALKALSTALDASKDIVHITDTLHRIQYINQACENHLGYTLDELSGRTIWEVHGSDLHRQDIRTPTSYESKSEDPAATYTSSTRRQSAGTVSKNPTDLLKEAKVNLDISEAVNLQMRRGKDWEGVVTCRRKSGDVISLNSRVTSVSTNPKGTDFYVYVSDGPHTSDRIEFFHHPRGSVKSLRKGSYDVRSLPSSDGSAIRRQSVAKLHSVMMEAPITRVVNIITAAQNSSPTYIAQALDKVLEILRSTELYSPQLIHDLGGKVSTSVADPVATDLLGALLSHAPKPLGYSASIRRSSNDYILKSASLGSAASANPEKPSSLVNPRPSLPNLQQQASGAIRDLVSNHFSWDFDVIRLERLSDKKPLVWLGMSLMCQMDVPGALGCDEQTLQNWLTLIEANYLFANSYHNSTHAADVLQTTAYFLRLDRIQKLFDPLEVASCLIAAAVHDVDHPGKNSQFLCNTNDHLAVLYNDTCVLESHHSAVSFKLTFSDDRVNILKGLDSESYKFVRKNVIDMVLATDMAKHFEHVNKFINMLEKCSMIQVEDDSIEYEGPTVIDFSMIGTPENLQIIKRMIIKCADISNPLRPLQLCKDWAHRIANEYFNQTEEEKKRNIPVVMPQFDRSTCSIPKSQIGFIDFFIFDMFEAWNELSDIPVLMDHLHKNYQYWKDQELTETERNSRSSVQETVPEENSEDLLVEEIS